MKNKRIFLAVCCITGFISISMVLPERGDRNLKVLPKDISDNKLDSIMQSYTVALGVTCAFCHVKKDNSANMDFAADGEPMKENARGMMRMSIDINKKYFYFDKNIQPEYLNVVHCNTCHHGEPVPQDK